MKKKPKYPNKQYKGEAKVGTFFGNCLRRAPTTDSVSDKQRLIEAEELLSYLSTGYWICVLNDADLPAGQRIGTRIEEYWKQNTRDETRGTQTQTEGCRMSVNQNICRECGTGNELHETICALIRNPERAAPAPVESPSPGSPLIASCDGYLADIGSGHHITWDGDGFYGLLQFLMEVRKVLENVAGERRGLGECPGCLKESSDAPGRAPGGGSISDSQRLDWLTDQMVDAVYMDDGRIIDVGGSKEPHNIRLAIDFAMGLNNQDDFPCT